ncbi:MAG: FtsW/RodA/SpoVE family cell cycle protein [Muribaculaceae bacterium]|nr:FtsW/RodA/SpoVE family cell cycle protein [Muribaculaceae bacterium]MDE6523909.1 FtsW/RodA/SpoVE family cell cycle protein [Muribaculaceae bacterium]
MSQEIDGIYIRESLDGRPIETKSEQKKTKKATKKRSEDVVTALKSDPYIWGIYLLLVLISIIELYSASASEVVGTNVYAPLIRHGMFLGIGFVILYLIQRIHYGYITRFAGAIGVLSWLALAYSTFMGVEINGAQRAFMLGPFTVQPPEIVKLTVIIWLATILAKSQMRHDVKTSGIVYSAIVVAAFGGLLALNGLTNTLLVMVVSVSMFLICGIPLRKICIVIGVYGVLFGIFYVFTKVINRSSEFDKVGQTEQVVVEATGGDHSLGSQTQINRILRFLKGVHPEDELNDENRQVIMAKLAQARGGVVGKGFGNSRESVRLPLAFSDYIYSIVIEESGLIGGIFLMILYLLLLARAGYVAYNLNRALPAFLILGCAILIVFQALVHMAIVTGLFPVSGQPLPLISKGGTSVLVMSAAIGIMLSVSRYATRQKEGKSARDNDEARHLGDDMNAINASADN